MTLWEFLEVNLEFDKHYGTCKSKQIGMERVLHKGMMKIIKRTYMMISTVAKAIEVVCKPYMTGNMKLGEREQWCPLRKTKKKKEGIIASAVYQM